MIKSFKPMLVATALSLATLAPDRSFAVHTLPGTCTVFAIDAWTGVLLHRAEPIAIAAGDDVAVDCSVDAWAVDISWRGCEGTTGWLELTPPP